jgi:hypothetical protein
MALGNGKPKEGDKGSHFSYRLKVLKLLRGILDASGGGATVETAGALDITGTSGSTSTVYKSVTFVCVEGEVTIDGQLFPAGTYTFNNPSGTLAAITYDATASTNTKILFQK